MVQINTQPGQEVHETVKLTIDDPDLDFDTAREQAKAKALDINRNAMQLAWYNGQTDQGFPNYDCGPGDRPPWQVFADSTRGQPDHRRQRRHLPFSLSDDVKALLAILL